MTKNLQKLRLMVALFSSLFVYNFTFAAADLVVVQSSFTKSTIDRGDYFNATISVKNIGNVAAATSYATIFFTTDVNNTDIGKQILSRVSVKSLQPNETAIINFIYAVPLIITPNAYFPIISLDDNKEIAENNEQNLYCIGGCNSLVVTNGYVPDRNIPCPIIFVHGWNSNSLKWDSLKTYLNDNWSYTFGGTLHYCLNDDYNSYTSVKNVKFISLSDTNFIVSADIYYVNFDINPDGTAKYRNEVMSNQSAINKQGSALRDAIKKVLNKTGAKEVILVGHSMGGLASREYIQNKSNWQDDGEHHVAKLVTIGTPNGGSDASNLIINTILKFKEGSDMKSESVRDFRITPGTFLRGGNESANNAFYNSDVNCNGSNNDNIDGLNDLIKKPFPSDIPVANVLGINVSTHGLYNCGSDNDGDAVVCAKRADMNYYPGVYADKFPINSDESFFALNDRAMHNNLHTNKDNFSTIIQALDEPKTFDKAYDIPLNTGWFGNVTKQADNDPFPEPDHSTDYDDYRFQLPTAGTLRIYIFNIPVHKFSISIVDASYRVLKRIESNGASNIDQSFTMAAGTYFLEVEAMPEPISFWYPYGFALIFTPTVGPRAEFTSAIRQGCAPLDVSFANISSGATGYQWTFEGGTPSTSTASAPVVKYSTPGTYAVSLKATNTAGNNSYTRTGFISVSKAPLSNFNVSIDTSMAQFINLSDVGVNADYSWNFGDNTSSTETSPTHKYARTGSFLVSLVARNVCGSNAIQKTIQIKQTTPLFELTTSNIKFQLYPNPATDKVTIKLQELPPSVQMHFEVVNLVGMVHIKQTIKSSNTEISTNDLPNGIYLVNIFDEGQFLGSQKLVINR